MTENDEVLTALRDFGYAHLPPLSTEQMRDVNGWLQSRPAYPDVHVPVHAFHRGIAATTMENARSTSECWCVSTHDALTTPHIFERAIAVGPVAAAYLGRNPPVMYSVNAFWSRPGTADPRIDTQGFHKDTDDARFLAMFVYLADVLTDDDGPQDLEGPDGVIRQIYGRAGSIFLADTSRTHRGRKPKSHERGLFWFRFGISDRPPANVWDQIEPMPVDKFDADRYPADPWQREMIKLLVRP